MPIQRFLHRRLRAAMALFPQPLRFAAYRWFVDCDHHPDPRLSLKIAETEEELEACFRLLHDAYVSNGFMRPDPSGMRITIYHALPTTTTLCAKFDGEVVGTISLIRESVFGFPLQSIFDLHALRERRGRLAEVSALAVHPRFRNTGGSILFPLMKFMYEYCSVFFDTRHLVIAVNPKHIEMYESLLLFQRLRDAAVEQYDFANGAPAVGATLDLQLAPLQLQRLYGRRRARKNLYRYFVTTHLPNIVIPLRRYFTTNDPVMTPELLDYFFNRCSPVFSQLGERERVLLHAIYKLPQYEEVLPPLACVMCALLGGVSAAPAREVPGVDAAHFDAAAWPVASDAQLDRLRGGFDFGGGLAISFGFMRSITVNGDLVSQIHFSLPDLSRITADQAKAVSDALAQAHIVQNGAGNSAPVVSPASTIGAPSAGPLNIGLPTTGALTTIVQNSLNNQILQSLTVIDAGANSLSALRSINIQGTLRDALLGALGSH